MSLSVSKLLPQQVSGRREFGALGPLLASNVGQSVLALADQTLVSGGRFAISVVVGRFCGQESLGLYTLGFTVVLTLTCLQDSLVSVPYTIYSNRVGESRRRRMAGSTFVHHLAICLVGCLLLLAAALGLRSSSVYGSLAPVLLVLAAGVPALLLREFARRLEFARRHALRVLVLDLVVFAAQMLGLAWLVTGARLAPVTAHAAVALACLLAAGGWLALAGRRAMRFHGPAVVHDLRRHWRLGRWLVASQLVFLLERNAVSWLLVPLLGIQATGALAACMTIALLCNPFLLGVANVLEPQAAEAFSRGGRRAVWRLVVRWTALLVPVVAAFCGLVAVGGKWGLWLLYGAAYQDQSGTLTLMAFTVLAGTFGLAVDVGLRAVEQARAAFRATVVTLLVTLALTAALAPWLGVPGAAAAMLCGSAVSSLIRWIALRRFVFGGNRGGATE